MTIFNSSNNYYEIRQGDKITQKILTTTLLEVKKVSDEHCVKCVELF